jgi:hypothetical protein
MLIENYTSLLDGGWQGVFAQKRTHRRAVEHAVSLPMVAVPFPAPFAVWIGRITIGAPIISCFPAVSGMQKHCLRR